MYKRTLLNTNFKTLEFNKLYSIKVPTDFTWLTD